MATQRGATAATTKKKVAGKSKMAGGNMKSTSKGTGRGGATATIKGTTAPKTRRRAASAE